MDIEHTRASRYAEYRAAMERPADAILIVLRGHLYCEALLEFLISAALPRGNKLIDKGQLNYNQKLLLVNALIGLDDPDFGALRSLNTLRNKCAHELTTDISPSDIETIGRHLGRDYSEMRHESAGDTLALLKAVMDHLCGYMAGLADARLKIPVIAVDGSPSDRGNEAPRSPHLNDDDS